MTTVNLFDPVNYKNKKQNCMAVVLNGCHARMYTDDGQLLQKIALVAPDFTGPSAKNFLQQVDNLLDLFLYFYPLPVFVFGNKLSVDHFKNITSHKDNIADFFIDTYGSITEDAITATLRRTLKQHC